MRTGSATDVMAGAKTAPPVSAGGKRAGATIAAGSNAPLTTSAVRTGRHQHKRRAEVASPQELKAQARRAHEYRSGLSVPFARIGRRGQSAPSGRERKARPSIMARAVDAAGVDAVTGV